MKNIKEFLLEYGYNLSQFHNEFKTHSSYNSFTKMLNEENAATRLAAALITIVEKTRVYSLDVVTIDVTVLSQFFEEYQKTVEILRGQNPNLKPYEISQIQLRTLHEKAQLFFHAKGELHKKDLQASDWRFEEWA